MTTRACISRYEKCRLDLRATKMTRQTFPRLFSTWYQRERKIGRHFLLFGSMIILSCAALFLPACNQPREQTADSSTSPGKEIAVEAAPFDAFPVEAKFGIYLRFSQSVVSRGKGRNQTPPVTITPPVPGYFRWLSDSDLFFEPSTPLPAQSSYEVDLSQLPLPAGKSLSRAKVRVQLPEPHLSISQCKLDTTSTNPVVKKLNVSVLLNYPLEAYWHGAGIVQASIREQARSRASIKRLAEGAEDSIPVVLNIRENSLDLEFSGNEMLRPGKDGRFRFKLDAGLPVVGGKTLPGDECEVSFKDVDWRSELSEKLSNSEAQKAPVPALPKAVMSPVSNGSETLTVRFVDPLQNARAISHRRPAGEVIE